MTLSFAALLDVTAALLAPWGEREGVVILRSLSFRQYEDKLAAGPAQAALVLLIDESTSGESESAHPLEGGVATIVRCGLRVSWGLTDAEGESPADERLLKLIDSLTFYLRAQHISAKGGDFRDDLFYRFRNLAPLNLPEKQMGEGYEVTFAVWHEIPAPKAHRSTVTLT